MRFVAVLLAFGCVFGLCACVDLGAYEDETAFYAAFSDIYFVCPSDTITPPILEYDIEEVTSKETQSENTTPMPEDYYKYVVFQLTQDTVMDDFSLWFLTETEFSGSVKMEMYVADSLVKNYFKDVGRDAFAGKYERRTSDGLTETVTYLNFDGYGTVDDGQGHTATYTPAGLNLTDTKYVKFTFSYNDGSKDVTLNYSCKMESPYVKVEATCNDTIEEEYTYVADYEDTPEAGLTNKIAEDSAVVKSDEWNSFYVENWIDGGTTPSNITIPAGKYIYVKILNNCSGAERKKLSPIAFRANNLLIRAIG